MPDIFLIDGNAIGFACHTGQKLTVGTQQTQAVYGIVRTMRQMQIAFPKSYKAILWDGRAQWRIDRYPDYKGNRESNPKMLEMREAYKSQRAYIEQAVQHLGIDQMRSPICEADDLAGALSQVFSMKGKSVRLITADRDWLQLVDERVDWHDPIRDRLISHSNFEEETGFKKPTQILDLKCLMGDTSDNVKGVGGIGEVGAKKLLNAYGSVDTFLKLAKDGKLTNVPGPWQKLISNETGHYSRYVVNREIMNLRGPAKPGVSERVVTKGTFDPDAFRTLAEDLAFHSILSSYDSWISPFTKRHV